MAKVPASLTTKRLLLATIAFGAFLLCDIALFGWLMFRSLSQRELERAMLETEKEGQLLADRIARRVEIDKDIYTAVAVEKEVQTYIDSVLTQKDIVHTVEIRDQNGFVVLQDLRRTRFFERRGPLVGSPELPRSQPTQKVSERKVETPIAAADVPNIRVPIGSLGVLEIGLSESEIAKRTATLRRELIRQTSLISVVTLALLASAYAIIWTLLKRARRLELVAAEAERMAYVGTLASGLAHEIRNPLNSLNLNMQMLEEEIDETGTAPTGRRLLAITRSEISRLERLVTDFLSYAKPRPIDLVEERAAAFCERVLEVLAGEIQRRGVLAEVDDRTDGALVKVDSAQMTQLLLNLAQNALAATEEVARRGILRLVVEKGADGSVVFEVIDNGSGITPEEKAKVFDLFYSTRKGGTGLGLAIVERIAKTHGGSIGIESMPGQGTVVSVTLPATPAAS